MSGGKIRSQTSQLESKLYMSGIQIRKNLEAFVMIQ